MKLVAHVAGVGVLGPGLSNWESTAAVLSGRVSYAPATTLLPAPTILPPAERRRTGRPIKLAIAVAGEATGHARFDPGLLASVFSSSGGDGHNCHELCEALALPTREISPTKFANSVHNAAAGYWSIATRATLDSTVLCAFDASFCAGLLEAMVQISVDGKPLLLVAYDTEYPEPLHAIRPIQDAFGVALVLTPAALPGALAHIDLSLAEAPADLLDDTRLEQLRKSVPAARCLPLLRLLARGGGRTVLDYLDPLRAVVSVTPCR